MNKRIFFRSLYQKQRKYKGNREGFRYNHILTVRNKLEDVIETLGYKPRYNEPKVDKKEILKRLDEGEITSEEAIKLLKGEE